jgi:hypothetical protein
MTITKPAKLIAVQNGLSIWNVGPVFFIFLPLLFNHVCFGIDPPSQDLSAFLGYRSSSFII